MFYDVFSEMCLKNGVSKNKAAQEIGLSNSIVTRWKKTGSTPNGVTMAKIANYFGVSVDSLLGLESEPKEEAKVPESSNVQNTNTSPVTRTIKKSYSRNGCRIFLCPAMGSSVYAIVKFMMIRSEYFNKFC